MGASPFRSWVAACAVAEAIGMTAASAAATVGRDLAAAAALALVVAGGLVEGVALAVAQGRVLDRRWPRFRRGRYAAATVLVAGLAWAAGGLPGVLADGEGGSPALPLMLLGAALIGLVSGALLGGAQGWALRGTVRHPWRWVAANAAAWPAAMMVIFAGAGAPSPSWSAGAVLLTGTVTGLLAGAVLGLVTGAWLGSLNGQPVGGRLALAWLRTRRRQGGSRGLVGLTVRGRRTGRTYRFPVQYATHGDDLVVVPGQPEQKRWWRNLIGAPTDVQVLRATDWEPAVATVLLPGAPGYRAARSAYEKAYRHPRLVEDQPVVQLAVAGVPSRGADHGDQRPDEDREVYVITTLPW